MRNPICPKIDQRRARDAEDAEKHPEDIEVLGVDHHVGGVEAPLPPPPPPDEMQ